MITICDFIVLIHLARFVYNQ